MASWNEAKLIEMTWKCTRTVLGQVDTETIETAQIVMRNNAN